MLSRSTAVDPATRGTLASDGTLPLSSARSRAYL